jgi:probable HAF family extracellular repeat protein
MKSRRFTHIIAVISFGLAASVGVPAQDNAAQNHKGKHHHYKLIDIGTFGGPNSTAAFGGPPSKTLNSHGTVVGEADTSTPDPYCIVDCWINHAFQLRHGVLTDLGTLPGVNSSFAFGINSRAWVAGFSQNGVIDPLTDFPETDAVLWKNSEMINLGTLGGNSSGANSVNNRGQVAGAALNAIPDPFSNGFPASSIFDSFPFYLSTNATQSHAFLWQDGTMRDLGTLGGPDSVAWFVNERGQVGGQSYINFIPNETTGVPTVDPFLVDEDGKMVDVGSLGGTSSFLTGLNNRGQMAGTMTLAGDVAFHPFLWGGGVLTDLGTFGGDCGDANALNDAGEVIGWACDNQGAVFAFIWKNSALINMGTVDGDPCSVSDGINSRGQVVGESSPSCFGAPAQEAFLWENGGPSVDLNTLISPNSGLELAGGFSINDRGEINGAGVLPNGDQHAFQLIPCDEHHPGVQDCDYSLVDAAAEPEIPAPPYVPSGTQRLPHTRWRSRQIPN